MKRGRFSLALGAAILLIFGAFALFPSAIAPYSPKEMFTPWTAPCAKHLLGTNDMGFDIFSEIIHAAGATLVIGVAAALCSLGVGTLVGILAGYLNGWAGEILNGVIQIVLMIPMLPMAIVLAAYLGAGTGNIILTIGIMGWCATARAVRARTIQLKQTPFVESLMILGISQRQIMLKHILPNLWEVVLAKYIMSVAQCMMLEATLSFIGLGDPLRVTWGSMVNLAYKRGGFARGAYNWLVAPGVCITLCVLAFYLINHYFESRAAAVEGSVRSYLE